MAGRGRGRGRGGSRSVVNEQLGLGARGEDKPSAVLQPPPIFPELVNKPIPIKNDLSNLLIIKQNLRLALNESDFFVKPSLEKSIIERYSDIIQAQTNSSNIQDKLDLSRFPKELNSVNRKRKKTTVKSKDVKRTKYNTLSIEQKLEELEKEEIEENADNENKEDEENDEEVLEGEEYDEIEEEGTDYVASYFDNGENYLDEEDDNLDDGGTYS